MTHLLAPATQSAPEGGAFIQGLPSMGASCGGVGASGPVNHWLRLVYETGPLGLVFLSTAVLSVVIVGAFVARTHFGRVHTREFITQLRRLVQAGNAQRAVRLTNASEAPVVRLARAGLTAGVEPARPADVEDAGYRDAAALDSEPANRARVAMESLLPALRSTALRYANAGRVITAVACASGAALAPKVEPHTTLHGALLGALALGALYTVFLQRRLERDLQETLEAVVGLCAEPALRAEK